MFCPNCKCEYREGYQYCSQCNVELVNELSSLEDNKSRRAVSRHIKFKSNNEYYLLNGILGFIGSPLFLLSATIAATQSQRLPPEWGEQSNSNMAPLSVMSVFLMIIIAVNIMGVISFHRKNKTKECYDIKLIKFILLNLTILVSSFVVFVLIGSTF